MKLKFSLNPNFLIVCLLAVVFFIATASFNYLTQDENYTKWTSPDESANYFFAKRFSLGQELALFDPAAIVGDNMVMPRSFRSDAGWLKPVSFLGIILVYGSLGSILGVSAIPFLTPFFAALGIIFFFLVIRKLFSERIGLISAFLLAFFPVYIYYSVRSMFHNVLFIVLLIMAAYLLISSAPKKKKEEASLSFNWPKFFSWRFVPRRWLGFALAFLGGAALGLAAITRTSELIWLLPALGMIWLFYIRQFGFIKLSLVACGVFLAIIPNIYFNQLLYSAPIYGGYNEMNRSIDDISKAGSGVVKSVFSDKDQTVEYLKSIYHNVFYFGFKPEQSLKMADHYIWEMFKPLCILFLLGLIFVIVSNIRKPRKKYFSYFLAFVTLSVILILYYGSWKFNDNPDPNRFTIGNSYTRYWLPIYLMMMPIAAIAIIRVSNALFLAVKKTSRKWQKMASGGAQIIVVLVLSIISLDFVLFGSEEGLSHLYYNNLAERKAAETIFSLTEPEAVIITRYYDKFLFPERRVIMGTIPDDEVLRATAKLVQHYPVYYYNFFLNDKDVAYLNERKLPFYGLKISLIRRVSHNFGLYKLEPFFTVVDITELMKAEVKK